MLKKVNENLFLGSKDSLNGLKIRGGDVIWIQYRDHINSVRFKTFQGTCISVVSRGFDTVFTLRALIGGVGVELRFHSLSRNIRQIKKVRSRAQRGGRIKLYTLREA